MVVGDLNARGSMQFQPMMQDELDKDEINKLDPLWQRYSADDNVNQHGEALCDLERDASLSQHRRHNLLFYKFSLCYSTYGYDTFDQ